MQVLNISIVICFCVTIAYSNKFHGLYEYMVENNTKSLILTPLLKNGKIEEAREMAEVKLHEFKETKSYSGYFTVSEQYNSNMFFWFFPSEINYKGAPVILWLQGGPGASSLIGLFTENGPFCVKHKYELKQRLHYWSHLHSVIYIDNPVGTGFSFTNNGYARNQTIIGEHLHEALLQFFQLFPELQKNDFYVAGESYAGKYVSAVSYQIMKTNSSALQQINLQGLLIGNGFCDPENQMGYANYLYQIGLIDINTKALVQKTADNIITSIHNEQWEQAYIGMSNLILGTRDENLFRNVTGFKNHFNFLHIHSVLSNKIEKFLMRSDVKSALHVSGTSFNEINSEVYDALKLEFMQSVAPLLTELLNNYRVLFYNGQLDIIVAYPLTLNFIQKLKFKDAEEYKTAKRHKWFVNGELAGYIKTAGKFTEVLVRNAGHMVPLDQPEWTLNLISRFTRKMSLC